MSGSNPGGNKRIQDPKIIEDLTVPDRFVDPGGVVHTGSIGNGGGNGGGGTENTVDVTDHGADDTGTDDVVPVLDELKEDNVTLFFPEGEYLFDQQFTHNSFENFGMVGHGATLTVDGTLDGRIAYLGESGAVAGKNVRFEGFDIDFTDANTGSSVFGSYFTGHLHLENVRVNGRVDNTDAWSRLFEVRAQSSGDEPAFGFVNRVIATDGGEIAGLWASPATDEGTILVRHSWMEDFEDNGFYGRTFGNGKVVYESCVAKNNSIANFRLGGEARNCIVIFDGNADHSLVNPRGYWMTEGETRLTNCHSILDYNADYAQGNEAINCHNEELRSVTVDGMTIEIGPDFSSRAMMINSDDTGYADGQVEIRDVTIDDNSTAETDLIRNDRDNVTFEDFSISCEANRDDVFVNWGSDVDVDDVLIDGPAGIWGAWWRGGSGGTIRDFRVPGGDYSVYIDTDEVAVENTDNVTINNGDRVTLDGLGYNEGDPSSAGEWNGEGREGVTVRDTTNNNTYIYNDGTWTQIG